MAPALTPNALDIEQLFRELEIAFGAEPEVRITVEKLKHKPAPWKGEPWKKK